MAEANDLPDWVSVGAKVAEVTGHGFTRNVITLTVERLTDTQVVCGGYPYGRNPVRRFRRSTLRLVGESYGPELMPLDAPEVRSTRARRAVEEVAREAGRLVRDCGTDEENYRAALDQIEQLARDVRTRLGWNTNLEAQR